MQHQHSRPDILRLLERRARCGLTFRELSEESGIPIPTLSHWASNLRREAEHEPMSEFVPVEIVDDEDSGTIAMEVGQDVRITVERGFDETHLSRVLSVLSLSARQAILACGTPVDFRKQHDGLVALVRDQLELDPFDGSIFVFFNEYRDRIKLLGMGRQRILTLVQAAGERDP